MMLRIIGLFVLACCFHALCAFPTININVATSWRASPSSCSSLNLAVQDKILEGLGMKKGSKINDESQNGVNINGNRDRDQSPQQERVPFIIQKIGRGKKEEIEEITRMCIDVFFNEQDDIIEANGNNIEGTNNGKKQVPPWKALQLAYLRNFQTGDILARNAFKQDQLVDLIVARRVYPVADASNPNGKRADIVDEDSKIYNMEQLMVSANGGGDSDMYMTGEIIGYSEVSEKNFGLGGNFDTATTKQQTKKGEKPRPYLSNLSVVEYARQSGVGSALLDACEEAVRAWDAGHTEIVLQVEEDNPTAIQFYKRRGWEFVFADPTCRRYDTSGFLLRETRITKYAMVKRLDTIVNGSNGDEGKSDSGSSSFIQKLRNSFFVQ